MIKKLLPLLLFIFLCEMSQAQIADSIAKKVDAIFADYDHTNSPGCALAVLKDGRIIYKRGYGMSNLEYNIAISPSSSIFHVASISKQFAAAAVVRLSLEGKLALTDDIRKYIPEVPDFGHTITFNHLLHHTSGLRDQWDLQGLAGWRDDDLITEKDVMTMLTRQKALNFLPGDEYTYCNTGYTLLGVAVKKVTGASLRAYADSVFFKPLGMTNTHFHSDHSEITPNRTSAYQKDDKGVWKISIPVFDTYGATSLFTTVEDLAKWDENFYAKKVGGEPFINAMLLPGKLNDETTQTYASGLVLQEYKGHKTVEHGGADAGYRSHFLRFPDEHFSVIMFSNMANINARAASIRVADVFLKDAGSPTNTASVKPDNAVVKGWEGEYLNLKTKELVTLIFKEEKLQHNGTPLSPSNNLLFNSPTTVYSFSGDSLSAKLEATTKGSAKKSFEKVRRVSLTKAQLQEFTGAFYSPELEARYKIETKENELLVTSARDGEIILKPLIKDMFTGFSNSLNITFQRDKKGKILSFMLSTGRVRHLYFEKITKSY